MFYFMTKKSEAIIASRWEEINKDTFWILWREKSFRIRFLETKYLYSNITITVIGTIKIIVASDIIYWLVNSHSGAT